MNSTETVGPDIFSAPNLAGDGIRRRDHYSQTEIFSAWKSQLRNCKWEQIVFVHANDEPINGETTMPLAQLQIDANWSLVKGSFTPTVYLTLTTAGKNKITKGLDNNPEIFRFYWNSQNMTGHLRMIHVHNRAIYFQILFVFLQGRSYLFSTFHLPGCKQGPFPSVYSRNTCRHTEVHRNVMLVYILARFMNARFARDKFAKVVGITGIS